jgi:hypothetical protein
MSLSRPLAPTEQFFLDVHKLYELGQDVEAQDEVIEEGILAPIEKPNLNQEFPFAKPLSYLT